MCLINVNTPERILSAVAYSIDSTMHPHLNDVLDVLHDDVALLKLGITAEDHKAVLEVIKYVVKLSNEGRTHL